jgi:hypothetical protein
MVFSHLGFHFKNLLCIVYDVILLNGIVYGYVFMKC